MAMDAQRVESLVKCCGIPDGAGTRFSSWRSGPCSAAGAARVQVRGGKRGGAGGTALEFAIQQWPDQEEQARQPHCKNQQAVGRLFKAPVRELRDNGDRETWPA